MKILVQDFKKQLESLSGLDYIWVKIVSTSDKGMSKKVGQATQKLKQTNQKTLNITQCSVNLEA